MSALNGFDRIAIIYDLLNRMVFGSAVRRAQAHYLSHIPARSHLLILGGGSGWLLAKITAAIPDAEIWYIDASQKMIGLSIKRTNAASRVHFIHGTEEDIPASISFDVIITPFFLDLFEEETLHRLIHRISRSLRGGGIWLAADFVNNHTWWQRLLLKVMYSVIHRMCRIEARKLPGWQSCLQKNGFIKMKSKFFFAGFIESTVFHRAAESAI
jgi:tRNA (cmo5U34)-methyltransferase